ncbi:hypothetical protein CP532_2487 [Ophiocordyceps camponoti-leonardi (nom. inval.)]|nr:hypothetical protein CP532_2487 [Ophiocordyceps camponoti-leonardi (nom. inval.)]
MAHKHLHRSLHDRRDVYGDARFINMEMINNDRPPPPPPPPPAPPPLPPPLPAPAPAPANDIRGQNQVNRQAKEAEMRTVIETIYKTLDPTFSGPIGGYVTLSEDARPPPSAAPSPASDRKLARIDGKSSDVVVATRPSPTTETPSTVESTSSSVEAAVATPTSEDGSLLSSSSSSSSEMAESPSSALLSPSSSPAMSPTPTPSSIPSPTPTATSHAAADLSRGKKGSDHGGGGGDKGGSPVGTKVGIAFGVISGIVALGLIAFFLLKRRRKQAAKGYKLEDEKPRKGFGAISNPFESSSSRDNPGAPRISLRPVTQFLPNWNGLEKRSSRGPMAAAAAASAAPSAPLGSSWDRSISNPFDSIPSTIAEEQSVRSFSTSSGSIGGTSNPFAGGPDAGSHHQHHHQPTGPSGPSGSVDLSRKWGPGPSSPTGTDYSLTSVSSEIAAAGGPPVSSVHRVQLDFKPTLDDEMELRIGELIRVLHEYDDGWCLVSRLDRSQQGVVPRTCLSTRPVKPRQPQGMPRTGPPVNPTGPGRGPNQARVQGQGPPRMGPPGGHYGRPPSPPGQQSFRSGPVGLNGGPMVLNSGPPTNRQGPMKPRYRVSPPGPPPQYPPMGPVSRKPVPG